MLSRLSLFTGICVVSAAVLAFALMGGDRSGARSSAAGQVTSVVIQPGLISYRASGEFNRGVRPVNAPKRTVRFTDPLTVMKTLVSEADYQLCVDAGACKALSQSNPGRKNYPVTGTSWEDASAYARWLSRETGETWRLPTDEEWTFIAGSKFKDDALALGDDADFAQRWIARYDQESARKTQGNQQPKPLGSFGENEHGITDLAGNVWEWTDTCFTRQDLGTEGQKAGEPFKVCGIRVTAGQHRAYVSDYTRDARGGGCAVGVPPSNLGFRLIRDTKSSFWQKLKHRFVTS